MFTHPYFTLSQIPSCPVFPFALHTFQSWKPWTSPTDSLKLHKRIHRHPWSSTIVTVTSRGWQNLLLPGRVGLQKDIQTCEINHHEYILFWSDLPTWNIRSGRIPNNSQILKYLNFSSKRLRIHNVIQWDNMIHPNPRFFGQSIIRLPIDAFAALAVETKRPATLRCKRWWRNLPQIQMLSWNRFIKGQR